MFFIKILLLSFYAYVFIKILLGRSFERLCFFIKILLGRSFERLCF